MVSLGRVSFFCGSGTGEMTGYLYFRQHTLMNRLTCFLTLLAGTAFGQAPADSVALLKTKWTFQDIAPGVTWKHAHCSTGQLFGSNQNIHVLDTKLKNRKIRFGFASADTPGDSTRHLVRTSEIARKAGAFAAVNGTFFHVKGGGSEDLVRIGGRLLDTTLYVPGKPMQEHKQAAITIRGRKVRIERAPEQNPDIAYGWDQRLNAPDVMVTGPLLIWDGHEVPLKKNAFNDNRHPRTAACVTKDKHLLLVTADGRNAQAQGLSLYELAYLLRQFGCDRAVNLDGGGSTTMYIEGQPDQGVVNMPSDNKLWDHLGERPVSNVFLMRRK